MLDKDLVTAEVGLLPFKGYFELHTVLTTSFVCWMPIRFIKGQKSNFLLFTASLPLVSLKANMDNFY